MLEKLAPRERQILDLLYRLREASASEVREALGGAVSSSAVRTMLTRLEAKGFVKRTPSEKGYSYAPALPAAKAKKSALQQVVRTFFDGSAAGAASALLGMTEQIDPKELDELERLIARARREQAP